MKRSAVQSLIDWKNSPYRTPRILQGYVRWKNWLLKVFGQR